MTQTPTSSEPISVLLADDQALLRAGFAMVIDSQPDMQVVAQAGDGAEALPLVRQHRPDVVLMDIRMPQLDGLEATSAITGDESLQASRIIVLTTFDTDEYALQALRSGASGFLLKDVQPEVLLDSIRTVVTGGAVIAPSTTRRLLDSTVLGSAGLGSAGLGSAGLGSTGPDSGSAEPAAPSPQQRQKLEMLTNREREILSEMATGDSNTEIAARLYLSEATVKTHVGQVLAKLGCRDRVQAVVFAYDAGIAARAA